MIEAIWWGRGDREWKLMEGDAVASQHQTGLNPEAACCQPFWDVSTTCTYPFGVNYEICKVLPQIATNGSSVEILADFSCCVWSVNRREGQSTSPWPLKMHDIDY